jgi:predicted HTH domain antitoxin
MTFTVPLPASLEQKMEPQSAKLHLAVGAFSASEVTLGQGAEIAGLSQTEFMQELARRRIPLHYDRQDFAEDLQTIARLNEKLDHACRQ